MRHLHQQTPEAPLELVSQEAVDQYLEALRLSNNSDHTIRAYRADLNKLVSWLKDSEEDLEHTDQAMRQHLTEEQASGLSPKTLTRKASALRSFAAFFGYSVLVKFETPKPTESRPEPLPNGIDDVKTMMKHVRAAGNLRAELLFALQGTMGLSVEEARSLTLADIDTMDGVITVFGKGDKVREVPISGEAMPLLKAAVIEVHAREKDHRYGRRIIPWGNSYCRRLVNDVGRAALGAQGISSHRLRATAAAHMLNSGVGIQVVQEILGHRNAHTLSLIHI